MATNDEFFKKAEEFGKELKNHSSKYLKEIKVILHDCLEPFFNKWWDEASQLRRKSEGGDGIYSKSLHLKNQEQILNQQNSKHLKVQVM